jgi:F420 biosynthesis protein FbiB-like protein
VYPLDYGYLEGTQAMDGGGVDVWVGTGSRTPVGAAAVTVDLKKRDAEIKLFLGCTWSETQRALDFMNDTWMRALLIRRGMEGLELLETRTSVRAFKPDPVPPDLLEQVLQAATWAPSAHNRQPWRFAVLSSLESKARLAEDMGAEFVRDLAQDGASDAEAAERLERSRKRILHAPVAILICLDVTELDKYPDGDRQHAEVLMGVQSVAMAGENLLLAAHALGMGGVWVCAPLFAPVVVRYTLDLPIGWEPQGLVLLGYPARLPERRPRGSVADITRYY